MPTSDTGAIAVDAIATGQPVRNGLVGAVHAAPVNEVESAADVAVALVRGFTAISGNVICRSHRRQLAGKAQNFGELTRRCAGNIVGQTWIGNR